MSNANREPTYEQRCRAFVESLGDWTLMSFATELSLRIRGRESDAHYKKTWGIPHPILAAWESDQRTIAELRAQVERLRIANNELLARTNAMHDRSGPP